MKSTFFSRLAATLLVMAGVAAALAQSGNDLLPPFPAEAKVENGGASPDRTITVPARDTAGLPSGGEDTRRALELADTFLRRQQGEASFSVPRRGLGAARVPVRTPLAAPAIARGAGVPSVTLTAPAASIAAGLDSDAGPSSELLPLPGADAATISESSSLPDAATLLPPGTPLQTEGDTAPPATDNTLPDTSEVPDDELSPVPAYGSVETQERRGPIFRVSGAEAIKAARARGFKFTPAGGIGARDGNRTAASQFPHTLTSEVHGTRMSQLRPPSAWNLEETSNTFFMFCDDGYKAVRLAPGWRIRGIRLEGPAWSWVAVPRSGASTASFSIRIHATKNQETATSVQLAGITLEGPEGASDWQDAFPNLNAPASPAGRGARPVDAPRDLATASEAPLPE